jgi:hypothetical protein
LVRRAVHVRHFPLSGFISPAMTGAFSPLPSARRSRPPCIAGLIAAAVLTALAEPPVPVLLSDAVVGAESFSKPVAYGEGLNGLSFQQDAILSHNGWQYVAYYNAARRVCVARRKPPDGAWRASPPARIPSRGTRPASAQSPTSSSAPG